MDVTSEEIRSSRFQGTRHVYDRREVDAFLHRAASTLEMYERKLTVTESHVASLEKALELAQSRARSAGGLDARIAELEAALAASQHNYESAMSGLEAGRNTESADHSSGRADHELMARLEASEAIMAESARAVKELESQADANADAVVSAARAEAEEILRTALSAQTSILEDVERMRLEAEATVAAQLELLAAERAELAEAAEAAKAAGNDETDPGAVAVAHEALTAATERAVDAESRASAFETELLELRGELATLRGAEPDEVEVETGAEVGELRRQVAQMRTALAQIQQRFSSAAKLSPEELELATALVDLDLHDVDLLVDLTAPPTTEAPDRAGRPVDEELPTDSTDDAAETPRVAIKSKWAQAGTVPAGALTEGRSEPAGRVWPELEQEPPNWRESFGTARREAAKKAAEQKEPEPLGFYERRLAGLRDRIRDAGVEPDA